MVEQTALTDAERVVLELTLDEGMITTRQLERRLRVKLGRHATSEAYLSLQSQRILVSLGLTSSSTRMRLSRWLQVSDRQRALELLDRNEQLRLTDGPRMRLSGLASRSSHLLDRLTDPRRLDTASR